MRFFVFLVTILIFSSCRKENCEVIDYSFEVNISSYIPSEDVRIAGITGTIESSYDFNNDVMKCVILSDKEGIITYNDYLQGYIFKEVTLNQEFIVHSNNLSFRYEGKVIGEHTLYFVFYNNHGYKITKSLKINFNK